MNASDSQLYRSFLVLAISCLLVTVIVVGKPVLAPLALGCILAFVLTPVVRYLEARGVNRAVAVTMTTTCTVLVIVTLSVALIGQLGKLATGMPEHEREIQSKIASIHQLGDAIPDRLWRVIEPLVNRGEQIPERLKQIREPANDSEMTQNVVIVEGDSGPKWLEYIPTIIWPIVEPLITGTLVVVLAVFVMLRRDDLRNRLLALLGRARLTRMTQLFDDSSHRLGRYLLGLLSVNFGFAVLFAGGLYIIGVPYAVLWGGITFFFRFIPYVGTALSMLLPFTMAIVAMPGWLPPVAVVAWYATLEFSSGNFVEPWLFGRSVGMNPLAVIVALMFWTWAWGMIGLLLATPLSLILVTLGRHFPCFEFLDLLLGDTHPLPRHVAFYQRVLAHDDVEIQSMLQQTVRNQGLAFTAQRLLLDTFTHVDRELRRGAITQERYREAIAKIESLAEQLIDQARKAREPAEAKPVAAENEQVATTIKASPLRIATFGIGEQRSSWVLRVLLSGRSDLEVVFNQAIVTPYMVRKCKDAEIELVILSSTGTGSKSLLEAACRTLRRLGYEGWIAVGWWRQHPISEATRRTLKEAGADYVTHRTYAMNRMLDYTQRSHQGHEVPTPAADDVSIPPLLEPA